MKAVYIANFGGPEEMSIREIAEPPAPIGREVMVRVRAAALNRADLLQRAGLYPPPKGFSPNVPGLEFAGDVIERGSGCRCEFASGRVMAITGGEAQAEFITIDERQLIEIPANLDHVQAAAVPEAFITAHDAVFSQARLESNETLVIHAVGSGVGLAALQMAKVSGASVIGTSRTKEKLDRCHEFGLDFPVKADNGAEVAAAIAEIAPRGADVVLDLVGAKYFSANIRILTPKGRLMLVGLTGGASAEIDLAPILAKRLNIKGTVLRGRSPEEKAEASALFARQFIPMFETGQLRPNVDRVFPFSDVAEAHRYLASNKSFGKVILTF